MIKINLVAKRIPKTHQLIEKQLLLFVALLLASVVASFLWKGNVAAEIAEIESEISSKQSAIDTLQNVEKIKSDFEKKQKRREEVLVAIKKLQSRKIGPRPFLEDLNLMLPPDIWLTEVKELSFSITVKGFSFSNPAVAKLMRDMENSEHFSNVELTEIQRKSVQNEEVKAFTITVHWDVEPKESIEEKNKEKENAKKKGKKA